VLKKIWLGLLFWCAKALLSIRYRIRTQGLEKLNLEGGTLFLPNHPAEIDPVLVLISLWQKFQPRPIVIENFFYLSIAHYFMQLVRALPLPDLNGAVNKWKQKKIEKLMAYVAEGLKKGDKFLIYPSGRLKISGAEVVGGASFVHNLLKSCPDTNVVLIRTTGLWGSRFSRALTGVTPNFGGVVWEGIKLVLKNGIFLTPRRDVTIEIEAAGEAFPWTGTRLEVNQYLEKWYNLEGPEPLKLVSDVFWKECYPPIQSATEISAVGQDIKVSPEVERDIVAKIAELARKKPEEVAASHHLARDIGLDSLDVAQLYTFLDEKYDVEGLVPGDLQTVEDVLQAAGGKKGAPAPTQREGESPTKWPKESARPAVMHPEGETLQEAFLKVCERMGGHTACADRLYGPLSYRRLKQIALILAQQIRKKEEQHIGVLLPSSAATYLLIFAILLAGKIPVMLNWTVGARAIDHCIKLCDLRTVLSSRQFLNRMNNGDLGVADDLLLLLEDVRSEMTLKDKIVGFWNSFKSAASLLKKMPSDPNAPAVILFTSGTESLPKGVPLSHANILSNQKAALACIDFHKEDVLYGILPPFHSFGFSVTGVLPLLSGLRAYYAPDPTDAHGMVRDIMHWNITLLCSAPTFIRGVFRVAKPDQLKTLRYIVAGAEKTPEEIFDYVKKLPGKHTALEGYGITECAPVVTITRPGQPRCGVGQPLPGIELSILEPDAQGEGEICIRGPNVFHGYLGTQKSPFIHLRGKEWYLSGDRGRIEADGSLILSGRLKRFVKIGGEMVGLGGLEEELLRLATEKKWAPSSNQEGPLLAVAAREPGTEKSKIVLFATFKVSKEEVNAALHACGYGRIVKIAEVRIVEQIPLTGTGKVHYRALDEMLDETL
jgi:long-chain-fatty-acid--[acyl-carrier-protein] ligase